MAGIYGNSAEDQYFEAMLFRYLEECESEEDEPWVDDEEEDTLE